MDLREIPQIGTDKRPLPLHSLSTRRSILERPQSSGSSFLFLAPNLARLEVDFFLSFSVDELCVWIKLN